MIHFGNEIQIEIFGGWFKNFSLEELVTDNLQEEKFNNQSNPEDLINDFYFIDYANNEE